MDESQRAMVAARLATLERGQKKADVPIGTSLPEAATLLNVGRNSVQRAREVLNKGTPELVGAYVVAPTSF